MDIPIFESAADITAFCQTLEVCNTRRARLILSAVYNKIRLHGGPAGLSHVEIADHVGCDERTVRRQLARFRKAGLLHWQRQKNTGWGDDKNLYIPGPDPDRIDRTNRPDKSTGQIDRTFPESTGQTIGQSTGQTIGQSTGHNDSIDQDQYSESINPYSPLIGQNVKWTDLLGHEYTGRPKRKNFECENDFDDGALSWLDAMLEKYPGDTLIEWRDYDGHLRQGTITDERRKAYSRLRARRRRQQAR